MTSNSQFDTVAKSYPSYPHVLPLREEVELHSFRVAAGDVTGLAALDLGCGAGRYAQHLARWGAGRVVGVDDSAGMLELAQDAEDAEPMGITYRLADVSTDHLLDLAGTMDLVLSCYALPYAPSVARLTGMFTTARTVLREGGRFIAATLNPDYADHDIERGYYDRFNMRLTANVHPPVEGTPVHLHAWFNDPAATPIDVDAYWWSPTTYEVAAKTAGFTSLTWHHFTVSDTGVGHFGEDYWTPYLTRPHAVMLEAS
ncbi:MAG TPA: class I SAM-dependent methyltransferase [Actinophytocola sp.]|uniref:class I SAM-dependent methyltransferase n=1 Tax=Actinophytocola sp. TaxID=1872138 RepID=UPI002DDCB28B|nr:class I SAM-dependent methyltransferase [Actinophytocola sp.]HEV2783595.1 class I SAM-dependent methyltransferase [Actinophytocola sp.]